MACGDVLSLEDLQTAKKHQIFEAEVITGKVGGVADGADIDYATNQVTGQTQKTLPAVLRDAGFRPAPFTFATGGTLAVGDSDVLVLWPISSGGDGQYYLWKGAYPKVVPAASTPDTTGGVSDSGWLPWGDITLRTELASSHGDTLVGSSHGGTVFSDYAREVVVKFGTFAAGAVLETKNQALKHTDGLYYVWAGTLPKVVSAGASPDVYADKWACVGKLEGRRINELRNFTLPGAGDDAPMVKLAVWSIAKLGLGELIITADCKVNIFTEVLIPFAIDGAVTAIGIRGEGVINSLGFVPEIRVLAGIRGVVIESPCYSLEKFTLSQFAGNSDLNVVSKTTNTLTVESNPFTNGSVITWPVSSTSTDGTVYPSVIQFSTNSGAFYASGGISNGDGTFTLTGVKGALGTPNSELANVTKLVRFTSLAHQLPDGTYPRTAAGISLEVIENPEVRSIWVLQMYRAFSHGAGNGGGPGVGLGHYGIWDSVIVDGCGEFLGGTDISGGSIQGIEGGQFSNMHWFATRTIFNSRRMKDCSFSNCFNYAMSGNTAFKVLEINGLTWTGGICGWGTGLGYVGKLIDCLNGDNITISGVKFGRHNTVESGPVIKSTSRLSKLTLAGNSIESVSEGGFTTLGWIDTPELTNSCIGDNAVGSAGQPYLTMSTTAPVKERFAGTKFNQRVLTNAPDGVRDMGTASTFGMMDSFSNYRDAGIFFSAVLDINTASTWPDANRNIIRFGGTLTPGKTLGLPNFVVIEAIGKRSVRIDLSTVAFAGNSINITFGATTVATVSAQGIYTFEMISGQFVKV